MNKVIVAGKAAT